MLQSTNFGRDIITDFRVGTQNRHDKIQFDHTPFADFNALLAHATQIGSNTVITLDANNSSA